jgi:hypothetical protein
MWKVYTAAILIKEMLRSFFFKRCILQMAWLCNNAAFFYTSIQAKRKLALIDIGYSDIVTHIS